MNNVRVDDTVLHQDWGRVVRQLAKIPTTIQYDREGDYSLSVFVKRFGPWAGVPRLFREFAANQPEWSDVIAILLASPAITNAIISPVESISEHNISPESKARRLDDRPTYGDPIDFRGLRHEPVNEAGVVFLFGMVARELGYLVEAVQTGYPDCEAKRQLGPGKWQRVRIEFEYASRNFRDHGHPPDGCDVIVCWHHNWLDCPPNLEVVELSKWIESLGRDVD